MSKFNFETIPTLETERLILRRIEEADKADWITILGREPVGRYLVDLDYHESRKEEIINEIFEWTDEIILHKTGIRWAITLKPDNKLIGSCGFHVYSAQDDRAEIGYELHDDYWRQGFMSEAVKAVIDFCFTQLNVHRIEADVTVGNEASAGLLKKFGFIHEGTWRDRVKNPSTGEYSSLWQFGLLSDEWQAD